MGPVPVWPGLVSTGIDPMHRGPASLEGPPSLLSQPRLLLLVQSIVVVLGLVVLQLMPDNLMNIPCLDGHPYRI